VKLIKALIIIRMSAVIKNVVNQIWNEYQKSTRENKKLLMIDALLIYSLTTAIIQVLLLLRL
jgi:hypothetical protein